MMTRDSASIPVLGINSFHSAKTPNSLSFVNSHSVVALLSNVLWLRD
jgi:hypothetical protein